MVKNVTGGSGHKSQARKNAAPRGGGHGALRLAQDEGEVFAQVERMLGGANCHVMCADGILRLCVIRGKFRGRGKRDNSLSVGSLVLVGTREYESSYGSSSGSGSKIKDKLQNCDLLEVYRDTDKSRIRTSVKSVDWTVFNTAAVASANTTGKSAEAEDDDDEFIDFMTDEQIEMEQLIKEREDTIAARSNATNEQVGTDHSHMMFGDDDSDVEEGDI